MVNPPALVHRPQSRSMVDLVHLFFPRVWFTCTTWSWSELGGAARDVVNVVIEGKSPFSSPIGLPPVVRSPMSSHDGASVRLG